MATWKAERRSVTDIPSDHCDSSDSDNDIPLSELRCFREDCTLLHNVVEEIRSRKRKKLPDSHHHTFSDNNVGHISATNDHVVEEIRSKKLPDSHSHTFDDNDESQDSDSSVEGDDSTLDPTYDLTKDPEYIRIQKKKRNMRKQMETATTSSQALQEEDAAIVEESLSDTGVQERCKRTESATTSHQELKDAMPVEPLPDTGIVNDTRKRSRNPKLWKRNIRKTLNSEGLEHFNSVNKQTPKKDPKPVDCSRCKFSCSSNFSEEERIVLNQEYWTLKVYERKKDYLIANIKTNNVERVRVNDDKRKKRREVSKVYSFIKNGTRHRVCAKFFMATLHISHGPIDNAVQNVTEGGTYGAVDKRGLSESWNKTPEDVKQKVRDHIDSFPCKESHYTRKSTKRKYLDQNLTISKMYDLFSESYKTIGIEPPVKEHIYRQIFCEEFNLSFFKPKKDICASCFKFDQLAPAEKQQRRAEHDAHLQRYTDSMLAKQQDKDRSNVEDSFISASFDLQSVLQLPSSNVSLTYYSRKICVYNLTVWEGKKPNDGHCYCWSEVEGKRGSVEIASTIYKWLKELPSHIEEVSLFSDTCSGQNRNQQMAAMMIYFLQCETHNVKCITHNFLESGHSMMEVDSMHAAIEREKKFIDTYTMNDWKSIFVSSRRQRPYKVHTMNHTDFIDFKKVADQLLFNKKTDDNGDTMNWLLVKSFQFRKDEPHSLFYRCGYGEEFKRVVYTRTRGKSVNFKELELKPAYSKVFPISVAKKKDLLKLCKELVIPEEVHGWYKNIGTSENVSDLVPEPATEDTDDEI